MSTANAFLCGVPDQHCTAGHVSCSARLSTSRTGNPTIKAHGTREAAYNCYVKWLTGVRGYTKLRPHAREFSPPDGKGPVIFLAKKSKFGARLRRGKEGTRYMPKRGVTCVIV